MHRPIIGSAFVDIILMEPILFDYLCVRSFFQPIVEAFVLHRCCACVAAALVNHMLDGSGLLQGAFLDNIFVENGPFDDITDEKGPLDDIIVESGSLQVFLYLLLLCGLDCNIDLCLQGC